MRVKGGWAGSLGNLDTVSGEECILCLVGKQQNHTLCSTSGLAKVYLAHRDYHCNWSMDYYVFVNHKT